ncbi:hypothetical protein EMCRGX_G024888 [Ephydatia muelleri]
MQTPKRNGQLNAKAMKQTQQRNRPKNASGIMQTQKRNGQLKGNVIWRVLNVLAWRRECGTGRLSVPCKTNEAIEKELPTKLFKDESLTTSGRICKLHPKEALCISRERKYFIHCTVLILPSASGAFSPGYGFCLLSIDFTSYWWPHVVKDAIGCHLLLDTHLHRSVQGCCCIQGLLWRTRGNLLGCDYSLFYGIFPLLYCKAIVNNLSILKKLKCALCSNVLSQPLELKCSVLVCTKCLTECIAASGAVSCPCCPDDDVRPASNAILLCCYQIQLEDIVLVATGTLEVVIMKGMSVYHHLHLRSKLLRGTSLPVLTKVL